MSLSRKKGDFTIVKIAWIYGFVQLFPKFWEIFFLDFIVIVEFHKILHKDSKYSILHWFSGLCYKFF